MGSSSAFLSTLHSSDLEALAERWSVRSYRRNELIIEQRDEGRDVFFVLDGGVRVTLFSAGGREVAYRDLHPGDIFGELAAIDGKLRSASVIAIEATRAAQLSAAAFEEMVREHPSFTWALLSHLSGLLRRMTDRVFEFSTLVVRERVVCELLRRAEELGQPQGGGETVIPLPRHFELAATISTHREAVSREMSILAKRGLVERRGNRLVIKDRSALEALAGKDR